MNNIFRSLAVSGFMLLIPCIYTFSQIGVNTDGSQPDNSAMLDVKSTSKGFLPPRVALVAANFPDPVVSPTKGIVVYNTVISGVSPNQVCPGLYSWNGRRWVRFNDGVTCGNTTLPDNCYQDNTVTDKDGNIYPTLVFGDKEWMAKNLKVTHYRNGDPIPLVTDFNAWGALTTGARCYYNNDSVTNKPVYGALYNWYAVNDSRNICPTGWHIPTHNEWFILYSWIGAPGGGKMKETGTIHWTSPNTGATNETCFSGLPGGWRAITSSTPYLAYYENIGHYASWWGATPNIIEFLIFNDQGNSWYSGIDSRYGASVRCVKD